MGIFNKLFKKKPEAREHCTVCGRKVKDVYFIFDKDPLIEKVIGLPMSVGQVPMRLGDILQVIEHPAQFKPIILRDKDGKTVGHINSEDLVSNIDLILSKPYCVCKNCGATICIGCSMFSSLTILRQWSNPKPWKNHPNCPECGSESLFEYSFEG